MRKILIIDDDEFILFGLSKAVRTLIKNAEVLTARHGKEAVQILGDNSVDIVVTDLKMPVMNGYEVVDYVNKHYPCIPVYVMTGDYLSDVKPKFRSATVLQFISKPFSFRQLAADISAQLQIALPAPA